MRKLLILSLIISSSFFSVFGQWHEFNQGLYGGRVKTLCFDPVRNLLYAGTWAGVFVSGNKGLSWAESNNGLPSTIVYSIQKYKDKIYLLSDYGIHCSDNGTNWSQIKTTFSPTCISFNDTAIIIGAYEGLFYSINNGISWNSINTDFSSRIDNVAVHGNIMFISTPEGFFKSEDNGRSWRRISYYTINSIEVINNEVYACSSIGLLRSGDNFNTWTSLAGKTVYSVKSDQGKLYISTNNGIDISLNNGQSWVSKEFNSPTYSIVTDGNTIIAGTYAGIFRSEDTGNSWTPSNQGFSATIVDEIAVNSGNILAGTANGLYISGKQGNWINLNFNSSIIKKIAFSNQKIYAGTSENGVFLSVDSAKSWNEINNGISNLSIQDISIKGNYIFAGTDGGGVFMTENLVNSWVPVNNGLNGTDALYISSLAVKAEKLYAGTWGSGVFVSENNGQTWTPMNNGLEGMPQRMVVRTMKLKGDTLLAGTNKGLYLYSNDKKIWSLLKNHFLDGILISGDKIFTYDASSGIYMSEDDGKTWIDANEGLYNTSILSLASDGKNIYSGTVGNGIWMRPISDFKSLHLLPDTIRLKPAGNSRSSVIIKTNTDWIIDDTIEWIDVSPLSGNGNTAVQITASGNDSDTPRAAEIIVRATGVPPRSFHVIQNKKISLDELNNDSFTLYPNPAVNKVYIDGLTNEVNVRICDVSGNLMKAVRTSEYQVNIGDLRTGTYIMNWSVESKGFTKKVIKR